MSFKLRDTTVLSGLQINIRNAMCLLRFALPPESTTRIKTNCLWESGRRTDETTFSIAVLQQRLFLLLSDVVEISLDRDRNDEIPLPELWIDGRGRMLGASYTGTPFFDSPLCIPYRHNELNKSEVRMRGYWLAIRFAQYYRNYLTYRGPPGTPDDVGTLMSIWNALRAIHWGDWKQKGAEY